MKKFIVIVASLFFIVGCQSTQMTSGRQYINEYKAVPNDVIEKQIYDAANIEPNLKFPARIGLARIDSGQLTVVPTEEVEAWEGLTQALGQDYGEFVPISRLITAMVAPYSHNKNNDPEYQIQEVIKSIRISAARQHVDIVFIYEVFGNSSSYITPAYIANITIIGSYLLPGRRIKANGYASGILIDVRNGYPYGTAGAIISDKKYSTSMNRFEKEKNLVEKLKTKASVKLTEEVKVMFEKLQEKLNSEVKK